MSKPRIHFVHPHQESDSLELYEWIETHHKAGVDTESTGLDPYHRDWHLRLIQIGDDQDVFVIPVQEIHIEWKQYLKDVFLDTNRNWVGHNLSFDLLCIGQWLGTVVNIQQGDDDIRVKHHLLDSRHKGEGGIGQRLEAIANLYTPYYELPELEKSLKKEFKKIKVAVPGKTYAKGGQFYRAAHLGEGWRLIDIDNTVYVKYAAMDVAAAWDLNHLLTAYLDKHYGRGLWTNLYEFEMKLEEALHVMSRAGMMVDLDAARRLRDSLNKRIDEVNGQLKTYGINSVYANAAIAEYMLSTGFEFTEWTSKGAPKVDKHVQEKVAAQGDPVAKLIMESKRLSKRRTTYVDNIIESAETGKDTPKIHPRILGLGARTARMTSSHGLHQMPADDAEIRNLYIAPSEYVFVSVDYSQVEMRIAAVEAGETVLIEDINRGISVHQTVAQELFGDSSCPHGVKECCYTAANYRISKNTGFGWLFGGGAKTLAQQGDLPLVDAQRIVRQFTGKFKKLNEYKRSNTEAVLDQAFTPKQRRYYDSLRKDFFDADTEDERMRIYTLMDRLCYGKSGIITTPMGRKLIVDAKSSYAATNYKIQETARNVMAAALIRVMRDPDLAGCICMVIHDELLAVVPEIGSDFYMTRIADRMTVPYGPVTLEASGENCGRRWGGKYG